MSAIMKGTEVIGGLVPSDDLMRGITVTLTGLSFTASTVLNLGTISALSNGKIADATKLKGLAVVYVGGSNTWDIGATIGASANSNAVFVRPTVTQGSGMIKFTMLY